MRVAASVVRMAAAVAEETLAAERVGAAVAVGMMAATAVVMEVERVAAVVVATGEV